MSVILIATQVTDEHSKGYINLSPAVHLSGRLGVKVWVKAHRSDEGTRSDGQVDLLYFDVLTKLLMRRSWQTPTLFGPLSSATDFDDYRKVVTYSYICNSQDARRECFSPKHHKYKLNVKIDDANFRNRRRSKAIILSDDEDGPAMK